MALIHCQFFSQVLGLMTTMSVILPDPVPAGDNKPSPAASLPTLYLLHGRSDDHSAWQRRTAIERYLEGRQLAVVMPEVGRSYYTDMQTGQRYWTFISEEVPLIARHFFPLSDKREENYLAGLSMGGYGAFKLALSYPERYAAAASLSGALDVVRLAGTELEAGLHELVHVFGDPHSLAGSGNDLFALAESALQSGEKLPQLYQWCGSEDFLYLDNRRFRRHLDTLGIAVDYDEGPGGHEWSCWDAQIQRVLDWLSVVRGQRDVDIGN
ncbi:MAG: alpha/beta hydrolase family protein [Desulfobulbus sp.]|nr:alpha/beta hydrolase family protein [Desulfobulbus sp.]